MYVIKRDGTKVLFDPNKIIRAINKAMISVDGALYETDTAEEIAEKIQPQFAETELETFMNTRIGKWFIALQNDYNNNRVQTETMEQLSKISDEWCGVQTRIIGKDWVDNVPFGDIPITIVLPDDECIKFLKIGIYGCAQLYEYCDDLFDDIEENRKEY